MHKIRLSYEFVTTSDPRVPVDGVHHPLTQLLRAIYEQGSIRGAATYLGLSYRHVWGELKRWEATLGHTLILWNKGQSARLSDMGFKLMWAERHAQAQLAPQIQALRADIERSFATALNAETPVVKLYASHDDAVLLLNQVFIWMCVSAAA
jgi:putative molybdopterin biosynthesis protein